MEYKLLMSKYHLQELHTHAQECLPEEAVALLFGIVKGNAVVVRRLSIVTNSAESRTTFSVEPTLQYRLLVEAEERGEDLVCIFHSHPAPPRPSQTDLKNMKLNPVVWLIASRESGAWESQAYLLENEKLLDVPIIFSDEGL